MRSRVVVSVLVVLALVGFLWMRSVEPGGRDAAASRGARSELNAASNAVELAETEVDGTRATASGGARSVAAAVDVPPPPDDLLACLRRLGELYVGFARATQAGRLGADLERELRELLEPIVNHPDVARRILGMLQSGDLVRRDADGAIPATLSLVETGAFWSLWWAFASYNAPGELLRPGMAVDGRRFALDVFAALPWIRPEVARQLARHLLSATDAQGAPILDRRFLADLLALARAHPDVAALRELLLGLAERLDDLERMEILRFYLPADDPDRMIAEIKGFLGSESEQHGIQMASLMFEEATDDELRSRIAVAVLGGAEDPFAAAEFLARHGDALRNDMLAVYVMAKREGAVEALDAEYELLLGAGAHARARDTLVMAMERTPPERLLEIARNEPDDEVSATALYRATVGRDGEPSDEALLLLQELGERRGPRTTLSLIQSADHLARGFRRAARPEPAAEATGFLVTVVRDAETSEYYRGQALEALQRMLSAAEYEALLAKREEH